MNAKDGKMRLGALECAENRADQRPSLIDEGNPVSQPRGEFHGRSERFSDSVVAQPVKINEALARTAAKSKMRKIFIFNLREPSPLHAPGPASTRA